MTAQLQLSTSRASEKASLALYTLATTDGTIQDRLTDTWVHEFGILSERELPGEFQERFDDMYAKVTAHTGPSPYDGLFEASIRSMSTEDAAYLARQMVSFAIDVAIEMAKGR